MKLQDVSSFAELNALVRTYSSTGRLRPPSPSAYCSEVFEEKALGGALLFRAILHKFEDIAGHLVAQYEGQTIPQDVMDKVTNEAKQFYNEMMALCVDALRRCDEAEQFSRIMGMQEGVVAHRARVMQDLGDIYKEYYNEPTMNPHDHAFIFNSIIADIILDAYVAQCNVHTDAHTGIDIDPTILQPALRVA